MTPVGLGDWKRDIDCGAVRPADCGREVTVMGWVNHRRDHGGLIFVDLRDRTGVLQIVFNPDKPDCFALAEALRNEYVVAIRGRYPFDSIHRVSPAPLSQGAQRLYAPGSVGGTKRSKERRERFLITYQPQGANCHRRQIRVIRLCHSNQHFDSALTTYSPE